LVRLVILGRFGASGSQLVVVKLSASEGLPFTQLHSTWTLKWKTVNNILLQNLYIQFPRKTEHSELSYCLATSLLKCHCYK